MKEVACGACGIVFGIPDRRHAVLVETGDNFTCPNGCVRCFNPGQTEADKQRKRADRAMNMYRNTWERLQASWEKTRRVQRRLNGHLSHITWLKNKIIDLNEQVAGLKELLSE